MKETTYEVVYVIDAEGFLVPLRMEVESTKAEGNPHER